MAAVIEEMTVVATKQATRRKKEENENPRNILIILNTRIATEEALECRYMLS